MNSKENSTATAGVATVACLVPMAAIDGLSDVIDRIDGLTSKTQASKHLSSLLLGELEKRFGPNSGKKTGPYGDRTVTIHDSQWLELQWLAAEVWETCDRVVKLLDELDGHACDIANAKYEADKAVAT